MFWRGGGGDVVQVALPKSGIIFVINLRTCLCKNPSDVVAGEFSLAASVIVRRPNIFLLTCVYIILFITKINLTVLKNASFC